MEITAHFEKIKEVVLSHLKESKEEILLAMAWFTNQEIFSVLINKASEIPVHVLVVNDNINNRAGGLDFQEFINRGGHFYFGKKENPMHNKFCVIDQSILITGSYNYTYLAESINQENINIFKGTSDIIESYRQEFRRLISVLPPIKSIHEYLQRFPYQKDSLSFSNYGLRDIYAHTQLLKKNGQSEEAKAIMNLVESDAPALSSTSFKIEEVIYRQ